MAPSPLSQAVEHFTLAQLMADPNLCRNVLNDIGAQPAETFLLVAALEVRVPQTLIEHAATNDLAVVEPRLVGQLTERGIEQSRAVWAVEAWKEVVAGSALGLQTVRPADSAPTPARPPVAVPPSQPATVRPSQPAERPSEPATVRSTAPTPSPPPPAISAPATNPSARPQHGQKRILAVASVVIVVLAAAVVALVVTRPNNGKRTAATTVSSASTRSTTTSSSPSPTANLTAPLGPPVTVSVTAMGAWSATNIQVVKGQRISVTATGKINFGSGTTTADGDPDPALDRFTVVAGHIGAMIGLVSGSAAPFLIGSDFNGVAPSSGYLYLGINDVAVLDNSGQFTVTVRVQS